MLSGCRLSTSGEGAGAEISAVVRLVGDGVVGAAGRLGVPRSAPTGSFCGAGRDEGVGTDFWVVGVVEGGVVEPWVGGVDTVG